MFIHVVEPGDNVYEIGRRYGQSPRSIIADNQLNDPDRLIVGQALVVREDQQRGREKKKKMIVNGYTYPWTALGILREAYPYLTYLSIFSYQVRPDATFVPIEDEAMLLDASGEGVAPKMVLTNIEEGGSFSSELAHTILADPALQDRMLQNAIAVMDEKNYEGLDVDFEYLFPEDRDNYNQFLEKVSEVLHQAGYPLSTAVAPKQSADQQGLLYEAHDYPAHGRYVDEVIIMTYEWGYLYGPPMAVSPIDQVEKVIAYAVTEIPPEKILMGIPNYGYDWTLPYEKGSAAKTINNLEAIEIAARVKAQIEYDEKSQSPYFQYYDQDKKQHVVWFEDARSIKAKLDLVDKYKLGGISYWTVNNLFPANWQVFDGFYEAEQVI